MENANLKIQIYNSPARNISWFEKVVNKNRKELFEGELEKIEEYSKKGHVASVEDAIEYEQEKELQS